MSSKRKWDQPAHDVSDATPPPAKAPKTEDSSGKSASEAAAAAAAIAAKIAAQFGPVSSSTPESGNASLPDGHAGPIGNFDGDFYQDIDINDIRNRYLLTKSATQFQIHEETGASIATKGVWYPDRSKATEKDPPLYLHVVATTKEALDGAVSKIEELIAIDMGSLVEDKKDRTRERRKWPEEKLPVGLESIRNFNVRAKVVGPSGMFVKYIQAETQTRVQIKGQGSGFIDQETGRESDEPMHIHITGPDEGQVQRAKVLTEDLLEVVRAEHAKTAAVVMQQQMELHQAQAQYAAYSAMAGYAPPPPASAPPPPPPGENPPPPPPGGETPAQPPAPTADSQDAFSQYWAAYGYDVTSPQFKEWAASQQQPYGAQGYDQQPGASSADAETAAAYAAAGFAPPAPPTSAPPAPPASEQPPPPPPPS